MGLSGQKRSHAGPATGLETQDLLLSLEEEDEGLLSDPDLPPPTKKEYSRMMSHNAKSTSQRNEAKLVAQE